MRAAISVKGVDLERILEVTVFDPGSVLFNILLVSGVVAHDAAGQLYGKLETGLEAIIFRLPVQFFRTARRLHPDAHGEFERIQPKVREGDGTVGVMIEKKADSQIKSGRNGILCLHPQRDMHVYRRRNEHVPGVRDRIITLVEHESDAEFAAIPKAEAARREQRTVKISVQAVYIAHPRSVHSLHACEAVELKADAHLRVLANRRERRCTIVLPAHPDIEGRVHRCNLFAKKSREKTAVIQRLAGTGVNRDILRGYPSERTCQKD